LSVREYARIQTFPDDWQFCGPLSAQYKQIGNAVPVNLAWAVGRSLIRLFNQMANLGLVKQPEAVPYPIYPKLNGIFENIACEPKVI
jgi:hypothetical protein